MTTVVSSTIGPGRLENYRLVFLFINLFFIYFLKIHKYHSYNIKKKLIYQAKKPKKIVQEYKIKLGKKKFYFDLFFR